MCRIMLLFIGFLFTAPAFAQTAAPEPAAAPAGNTAEEISGTGETTDQTITEFLELSGLDLWLDNCSVQVGKMLQGLLDNAMAKKEDVELVQKINEDVYGSAQIKKYFYKSLKKYYSPERFGKWRALLQSPLGQKIALREKATNQLSRDEQDKEYENFLKKQPTEERLQLVSQLMYRSNSLRLEIAAVGYTRVPMLLALEPSISSVTVREDVAILVDELGYGARGARDGLFPAEGFFCRNFSDEELQEYIEKISDPDIEYAHEAVYQAMIETFSGLRTDFLVQYGIQSKGGKTPSGKKFGALNRNETLEQKNAQAKMLVQRAIQASDPLKMQEDFSQAVSLLEQLMFVDPEDNNLGVSLGITYQMAHYRLPRASILLEKAIAAGTPNAQAYFTLGLIEFEARHLDRAEQLFKKTIEMTPQVPGPDYNLAVLYKEKEQFDLAVKHLERAVALDSKDAGAFGLLGMITAQQGKTELAKKYLDEAKRLGLDAKLIKEVEDKIQNPGQ